MPKSEYQITYNERYGDSPKSPYFQLFFLYILSIIFFRVDLRKRKKFSNGVHSIQKKAKIQVNL